MIVPEFQNPPPNPITLEYLAGRLDGFNGRIKSLESRVSSLAADNRDRHAGQRQTLFVLRHHHRRHYLGNGRGNGRRHLCPAVRPQLSGIGRAGQRCRGRNEYPATARNQCRRRP